MSDPMKSSREAAEAFGEKIEEAAGKVGEAIDALEGKSEPEPDSEGGETGTTVIINTGRG